MMITPPTMTPEMSALKTRLKTTWESVPQVLSCLFPYGVACRSLCFYRRVRGQRTHVLCRAH
jgi:hypothetical protein